MPYPIPATPSGVSETAWAATVAEVRAYCGWHIAPEAVDTITLDGHGGTFLDLPTMRLVSLDAVTSDGLAVTDPEWSTSGLVRSPWTLSTKLRGVSVTMTHGYEEWPPELLAVMTEMASTSSPAGVKQVTSGSHQVTFESSLRSSQRAVLDRYRLVVFA